MHDEDKNFSLNVTSSFGAKWHVYGDKPLFDNVNRDNLKQFRLALQTSANGQHTKPARLSTRRSLKLGTSMRNTYTGWDEEDSPEQYGIMFEILEKAGIRFLDAESRLPRRESVRDRLVIQ